MAERTEEMSSHEKISKFKLGQEEMKEASVTYKKCGSYFPPSDSASANLERNKQIHVFYPSHVIFSGNNLGTHTEEED